MLELSGCIVTIDAMGTQKEIAKADYILSVKENQPRLYEDISLFFSTEASDCDYAKTTEKSHGRTETRECYSKNNIQWLEQRKEWCGISEIGIIVINI